MEHTRTRTLPHTPTTRLYAHHQAPAAETSRLWRILLRPASRLARSLAGWLAGWLAGFAIKEIPGAFEGGESLGESPPRQARG